MITGILWGGIVGLLLLRPAKRLAIGYERWTRYKRIRKARARRFFGATTLHAIAGGDVLIQQDLNAAIGIFENLHSNTSTQISFRSRSGLK